MATRQELLSSLLGVGQGLRDFGGILRQSRMDQDRAKLQEEQLAATRSQRQLADLQLEEKRGKVAQEREDRAMFDNDRMIANDLKTQGESPEMVNDWMVLNREQMKLGKQRTPYNVFKSKTEKAQSKQRKAEAMATEKAELGLGKLKADIGLREAQTAQAKKATELAGKKAKQPQAKSTQYQAATFGRRLEQANEVFDRLEQSGYDRTGLGSRLGTIMPAELKSSERKQQDQAERNFVNAVLRRESGAAISPTEFDSAEQQYFPRPGDSAEVLKQKKANRLQVAAGLRAESGPAWEQVPLVSTQAQQKNAFDSEEAAMKAVNSGQIKAGDEVVINGQRMVWRDN